MLSKCSAIGCRRVQGVPVSHPISARINSRSPTTLMGEIQSKMAAYWCGLYRCSVPKCNNVYGAPLTRSPCDKKFFLPLSLELKFERVLFDSYQVSAKLWDRIFFLLQLSLPKALKQAVSVFLTVFFAYQTSTNPKTSISAVFN